jgi:hypothetical protein
LENKTKNDKMSEKQDTASTTESIGEVWSNQDKETSKSRYGCEIIKEKCLKDDAKDNQLPRDTYLVNYIIDDTSCYDLVRAGKQVSLFDMYYDKFGNCIQSIEWTDGKVNPRLWGYKPPETKRRK